MALLPPCFAATNSGDTLLPTQAFQHNADFVLGRVMLARRAADVLDGSRVGQIPAYAQQDHRSVEMTPLNIENSWIIDEPSCRKQVAIQFATEPEMVHMMRKRQARYAFNEPILGCAV